MDLADSLFEYLTFGLGIFATGIAAAWKLFTYVEGRKLNESNKKELSFKQENERLAEEIKKKHYEVKQCLQKRTERYQKLAERLDDHSRELAIIRSTAVTTKDLNISIRQLRDDIKEDKKETHSMLNTFLSSVVKNSNLGTKFTNYRPPKQPDIDFYKSIKNPADDN